MAMNPVRLVSQAAEKIKWLSVMDHRSWWVNRPRFGADSEFLLALSAGCVSKELQARNTLWKWSWCSIFGGIYNTSSDTQTWSRLSTGIYTFAMVTATPISTTATLLYITEPEDGAPAYQLINADPLTGERQKNIGRVEKSVVIENVRGKEDSVSLDTAGFQFYKHTSKHTSFSNDEEIRQEYYPESVELIKQLTGASRVELFDYSKWLAHSCIALRDLTFDCITSHTSSSSRRGRRLSWPSSTGVASSCRSDYRLIHRSSPQTSPPLRRSETSWTAIPDHQSLATHCQSCYRLAFGPLWLSKRRS